jgi:hypothetical protein
VVWAARLLGLSQGPIWAASVQPVPHTKKFYTENPEPIVVLALRKGAKPIDAGKIQNWQPVPPEKQYVFESTVGEKVLLRIEDEDPRENDYESLFPNKTNKRKHPIEDESFRRDSGSYWNGAGSAGGRGGFQQRGGRGIHRGNGSQRGHRGGGNRGNGGGRGGRGRGGGQHYRSLDDVGEKSNHTPTYNAAVAYEDFPPLQKQYQTPQQLVQQQFEQYQQYQQQMQAKGGSGSKQGGMGEMPY